MPVGAFDPPLDMHTRIVERERGLAVASREPWRPPRVLVFAVAGAGVALLLIALALAAHSRSSAPKPANPKPPPTPPAYYAGLPPAGTQTSGPAAGRLVLKIEPQPHTSWDVYADGRIIWQKWTDAGDPRVIPGGTDPHDIGYVQQRLTPTGVQMLRSQILALAQPAGLFRRNVILGRKGFEQGDIVARYKIRIDGRLIEATVMPPSYFNGHRHTNASRAQIHALARIRTLLINVTNRLPASAWTDTAIRPYVPSHYAAVFDQFRPDPARLPSPAREMLRRYQPLIDNACQIMTTDHVRQLLAAFERSGVKLVGAHALHLEATVPAERGHHTILSFLPQAPVERRLLRTGACG